MSIESNSFRGVNFYFFTSSILGVRPGLVHGISVFFDYLVSVATTSQCNLVRSVNQTQDLQNLTSLE